MWKKENGNWNTQNNYINSEYFERSLERLKTYSKCSDSSVYSVTNTLDDVYNILNYQHAFWVELTDLAEDDILLTEYDLVLNKDIIYNLSLYLTENEILESTQLRDLMTTGQIKVANSFLFSDESGESEDFFESYQPTMSSSTSSTSGDINLDTIVWIDGTNGTYGSNWEHLLINPDFDESAWLSQYQNSNNESNLGFSVRNVFTSDKTFKKLLKNYHIIDLASTENVVLKDNGIDVIYTDLEIDSMRLVPKQRILLKNQTDSVENGIYVYNNNILTLDIIFESESESESESILDYFSVFIKEGLINKNLEFFLDRYETGIYPTSLEPKTFSIGENFAIRNRSTYRLLSNHVLTDSFYFTQTDPSIDINFTDNILLDGGTNGVYRTDDTKTSINKLDSTNGLISSYIFDSEPIVNIEDSLIYSDNEIFLINNSNGTSSLFTLDIIEGINGTHNYNHIYDIDGNLKDYDIASGTSGIFLTDNVTIVDLSNGSETLVDLHNVLELSYLTSQNYNIIPFISNDGVYIYIDNTEQNIILVKNITNAKSIKSIINDNILELAWLENDIPFVATIELNQLINQCNWIKSKDYELDFFSKTKIGDWSIIDNDLYLKDIQISSHSTSFDANLVPKIIDSDNKFYDGIDDYSEISNNTFDEIKLGSGSFTSEFKVIPDNLRVNQPVIYFGDSSTTVDFDFFSFDFSLDIPPFDYITFYVNSDDDFPYFVVSKGNKLLQIKSNKKLTLHTETIVSFTWSYSANKVTARLYFDGVLVGTLIDQKVINNGVVTNTPIDIRTINFNKSFIGKSEITTSPLYEGRVSEVRLWDIVLNSAQVSTRAFKSIVATDILYPNLKGYWKLDDSTSYHTDSSSYDNSGIFFGGLNKDTILSEINSPKQIQLSDTTLYILDQKERETFSSGFELDDISNFVDYTSESIIDPLDNNGINKTVYVNNTTPITQIEKCVQVYTSDIIELSIDSLCLTSEAGAGTNSAYMNFVLMDTSGNTLYDSGTNAQSFSINHTIFDIYSDISTTYTVPILTDGTNAYNGDINFCFNLTQTSIDFSPTYFDNLIINILKATPVSTIYTIDLAKEKVERLYDTDNIKSIYLEKETDEFYILETNINSLDSNGITTHYTNNSLDSIDDFIVVGDNTYYIKNSSIFDKNDNNILSDISIYEPLETFYGKKQIDIDTINIYLKQTDQTINLLSDDFVNTSSIVELKHISDYPLNDDNNVTIGNDFYSLSDNIVTYNDETLDTENVYWGLNLSTIWGIYKYNNKLIVGIKDTHNDIKLWIYDSVLDSYINVMDYDGNSTIFTTTSDSDLGYYMNGEDNYITLINKENSSVIWLKIERENKFNKKFTQWSRDLRTDTVLTSLTITDSQNIRLESTNLNSTQLYLSTITNDTNNYNLFNTENDSDLSITQTKGWTIGEYGLFLTDDNNDPWELILENIVIKDDLLNIEFYTHNVEKPNGYGVKEVSDYGWVSGKRGRLLKTIDKGLNWTVLNTGTFSDIKSISFMSEKIGLIAGDNNTLLSTFSGGDSFIHVDTSIIGFRNWNKVLIYKPNKAILIGNSGTMVHLTRNDEIWSIDRILNNTELEDLDVQITNNDLNESIFLTYRENEEEDRFIQTILDIKYLDGDKFLFCGENGMVGIMDLSFRFNYIKPTINFLSIEDNVNNWSEIVPYVDLENNSNNAYLLSEKNIYSIIWDRFMFDDESTTNNHTISSKLVKTNTNIINHIEINDNSLLTFGDDVSVDKTTLFTTEESSSGTSTSLEIITTDTYSQSDMIQASNGYLYYSSFNNNIGAINPDDNTTIFEINTNRTGHQLLQNPYNGYIYYAGGQILDPISNTIIVDLSLDASYIVLNQNNGYLYYLNNNSYKVHVVDTTIGIAGQLIHEENLSVANQNCNILYVPTNNKIYYSKGQSNEIGVMDGIISLPSITIPFEPVWLEYASDTQKLYVAGNNTDNIIVIDTTTDLIIANIVLPIASYISDMEFSPDYGYLMVTNYSSTNTEAYIINTLSDTIISTIPLVSGSYPSHITYYDTYDSILISLLNGLTVNFYDPITLIETNSLSYDNIQPATIFGMEDRSKIYILTINSNNVLSYEVIEYNFSNIDSPIISSDVLETQDLKEYFKPRMLFMDYYMGRKINIHLDETDDKSLFQVPSGTIDKKSLKCYSFRENEYITFSDSGTINDQNNFLAYQDMFLLNRRILDGGINTWGKTETPYNKYNKTLTCVNNTAYLDNYRWNAIYSENTTSGTFDVYNEAKTDLVNYVNGTRDDSDATKIKLTDNDFIFEENDVIDISILALDKSAKVLENDTIMLRIDNPVYPIQLVAKVIDGDLDFGVVKSELITTRNLTISELEVESIDDSLSAVNEILSAMCIGYALSSEIKVSINKVIVNTVDVVREYEPVSNVLTLWKLWDYEMIEESKNNEIVINNLNYFNGNLFHLEQVFNQSYLSDSYNIDIRNEYGIVISGNITNETQYYNLENKLEVGLYTSGTDSTINITEIDVKYSDKVIYGPTYNIETFLQNLDPIFTSDYKFPMPEHNYVLNSLLKTSNDEFIEVNIVDNKIYVGEDYSQIEDFVAGVFVDISTGNDVVSRVYITKIEKELYEVYPDNFRYVIHTDSELQKNLLTYGIVNIRVRNTLREVSEDLDFTDNVMFPLPNNKTNGVEQYNKTYFTQLRTVSYTGYIMNDDNIRNNISAVVYLDNTNDWNLNVVDWKTDPNFYYRPMDLHDVGVDKVLKKAISVDSSNYLVKDKKLSLININKENYNYRLVDGMTTKELEENYYWVLNADIKNAIIGKNNENNLVWYEGDWICGTWENGTWYSGKAYNIEWVEGEVFSYDVVNNFNIVETIESDDETNTIWYNGTWNNGTWNNGTWNNGTWISGTRVSGSWNNGVWTDGVWTDGVWTGGIWQNGTWLNGTFCEDNSFSIWQNGTWLGGDFGNGTWLNGIWDQTNRMVSRFGTKSSLLHKAVWEYGLWKNGEFYSSLITDDNGNTISDNYKNSIWKNGIWLKGDFYGGIWDMGRWENGVFHDGYWRSNLSIEELNMRDNLLELEIKFNKKHYFKTIQNKPNYFIMLGEPSIINGEISTSVEILGYNMLPKNHIITEVVDEYTILIEFDQSIEISNFTTSNTSGFGAITNDIFSSTEIGEFISPSDITYSQDTETIYIVDSGDSTLYNTNINDDISPEPTPGITMSGVTESYYNRYKSELYLPNKLSNVVYVVNDITKSITNTITVELSPFDMVINDNAGKIYTSNKNDNSLSLLNTTNLTSSRIDLGIYKPEKMINVGKYIYIMTPSNNSVVIFDTITDTIYTTVVFPTSPEFIAYNNVDDIVYVSYTTNGITFLNVVNNVTKTTILDIAVGLSITNMSYNTNTELLYVFGGNNIIMINNITIIDTIVSNILSHNFRDIIFYDRYDTLYVIDSFTKTIIPVIFDDITGLYVLEYSNFINIGDGISGIYVDNITTPTDDSLWVLNYTESFISKISINDECYCMDYTLQTITDEDLLTIPLDTLGYIYKKPEVVSHWINGVFSRGIWENGWFNNGGFTGGIWLNGVFENGQYGS